MAQKEKLCDCIDEFQQFIAKTRDGLDAALRHDIYKANEAIRETHRTLESLESCLGIKFDMTRESVLEASRQLAGAATGPAAEELKLAQWRVFGEIRYKVCKGLR